MCIKPQSLTEMLFDCSTERSEKNPAQRTTHFLKWQYIHLHGCSHTFRVLSAFLSKSILLKEAVFPNKINIWINIEYYLHKAFTRLMTERGRQPMHATVTCHAMLSYQQPHEVTEWDLVQPPTTKNFTFCVSLKWTEKSGCHNRAIFLFIVSGIFTSIRANPTNAVRLYDIASQHIQSRIGLAWRSVSALNYEASRISK